MKVDVTTVHGAKAGSVDLPDETFGITPKPRKKMLQARHIPVFISL